MQVLAWLGPLKRAILNPWTLKGVFQSVHSASISYHQQEARRENFLVKIV
jgi:hypothetical protein